MFLMVTAGFTYFFSSKTQKQITVCPVVTITKIQSNQGRLYIIMADEKNYLTKVPQTYLIVDTKLLAVDLKTRKS